MCCLCGGGDSDTNVVSLCTDTDNGAQNSSGWYGCEDYTNGSAHGYGVYYGECDDNYDDDDFISADMCCHCGGGIYECRDLEV